MIDTEMLQLDESVRSGDYAFLRLLRVLRLQRYVKDMRSFRRFESFVNPQKDPLEVEPYQLEVARVLTTIFTLLFISSGLIYNAEHVVNPMLPDYFTALYFGLTTLTTVGYGDITPITVEGRLVVGGSILAGIAIIPGQLASLANAIFNREDLDVKRTVTQEPAPAPAAAQPVAASDATRTAAAATACTACMAVDHPADAKFCYQCGVPMRPES